MSEQKKKPVEPLFEIREYEAELFAPISTEVTVIVKPGSIVSVEVTNSILAVEVHGGTMNVIIEGGTVNVQTEPGTALSVDITAQSMGNISIDLAAVSFTGTLKVDIAAQSVGNIAVDIAAQSVGNVAVDIAAQSMENITVDIAAQSIGNIAVDIAAQSVENITVDIAAQSIENISIKIADVESGVVLDVRAEQVGTWSVQAEQVGTWQVDANITNASLNVIVESGQIAITFQESQYPDNLVSNPGFEEGEEEWTLESGWSIDNAEFYAGTASAKGVQGASESFIYSSNVIKVTPGQLFTVIAVLKGSGLTGNGLRLALRCLDPVNQEFLRYIYGDPHTSDIEGEWTVVRHVFTIPDDVGYIQVAISIDAGDGTGWVDNVYAARGQIHQIGQTIIGQTGDINVAIVQSDVTINISVTSSTIALPIDVQATTIALPVDIQAQTINLKIDIAAQSIEAIDIRITGQVENVNVSIENVSSEVTFNVKIMDATGVTFDVKITDVTGVTFDVKIIDVSSVIFNVEPTSDAVFKVEAKEGYFYVETEADVVLNIWTPSGKWVVGSDLLKGSSSTVQQLIQPHQEGEVFSATGRGRIIGIGFSITSIGEESDALEQIRLRIYVDGESSPSIDLRMADIDMLNGRLLERRIYWDQYDAVVDSNKEFATAKCVNPTGALTRVLYNRTRNAYQSVGGFLNINIEFYSSVSIRVKDDGHDGAYVWMTVIYGEYP